MKRLALTVVVFACAASVALAQVDAVRKPLPAPVKAKLGMLNVPALSPLFLLPEYAAAYNVQVETVMFQRFADARTALASGDLDITAFGPQDISLAVGQGARSLVGVAGVGSGNDCLVVRKTEDIRDWKDLGAKRIGIGYEDCKAVNPDVVYCNTYAYGAEGPLAHFGGLDPEPYTFFVDDFRHLCVRPSIGPRISP